MDHRLNKHDKLLVFLTQNMKEMETELRAQSMVLEALAQKMIGVDDLGDALTWARGSGAMKDFVREKYAGLEELCPVAERVPVLGEVGNWMAFAKPDGLPN